MRKALVIATSAAVALTGLTAMPASAADATYAADNAYAYRSANAMIQASNNEVTIPAGVMSVNFDVQFTLGADFFTNNAGKKITLKRTVKGPDGAVLSTGYYVGGEPSFRFCPANNQCDYSTWDKAELTVKNTHTSGSISVYAYASRQSEMMNMSRPDPLTPGKYTINAVIQADGVDVAVDEVQANIVTSRSSGSYSMEGETVSPAAGVSELNVSIQMCVDSTKIAVGDVLTPEIYVNDVKKTINGGSARFYNRDGSTPNPRMGGNVSSTATVTQTDIDYGLSAGANTYQGGVTSGATYVLKGKVVDQDGNDVTGDCAPTTPAKPTLSAQGQDLTVIPGATKFSEVIECKFYASNDLTKVLRTVMAMSNMPNSPKTCNYYNAPSGITYVVKTAAYYYEFASAESEVSNAVLIASPGYTVSPAVSGGDNGGEVSVVSNAINSISGSQNVRFIADATSALRLSVTSQSVSCPPCGPSTFTATLEKTTATGLSSTFAGTGSATFSSSGAGFPLAAWYGAGDKWTMAGVNVVFGAQPTYSFKVLQGTYGAAATTSLEVASSVFESACSSLGAGYTAKPSPQSSSFVINPISAPTAKQLYSLSCYKPTVLTSSTMSLANPVLVTIDNATTVTVVKVLGENSNVANAANTVFSASTSAAGTATALTILVTKRLITDSTIVNNMTTETGSIASREIVRLAADLTSTTTSAGWVTSGTSLATEPAVVVPQVNDGSFYAMQRLATDFKLMKVSATGAASAAIAITNDKATDMANYNLAWPAGLQSGSLANVSLLAVTPTKSTASARARSEPARGQ